MNVRLVMVQDNVEIVGELEKYRRFMMHFRQDAEYVMEPVYVNHVNERMSEKKSQMRDFYIFIAKQSYFIFIKSNCIIISEFVAS